MQKALAFLAFDQRSSDHSIDSLAQLCDVEPSVLDKNLSFCSFVEKKDNGQKVEFVCDVFEQFAKTN